MNPNTQHRPDRVQVGAGQGEHYGRRGLDLKANPKSSAWALGLFVLAVAHSLAYTVALLIAVGGAR